jgi:hypothetical protein
MQQGKDLSSQGNAITSLNNMLSSVKDDISKKPILPQCLH